MTPAKRRPATPASQGPTRAATKDSTQEAPTEDASGGSLGERIEEKVAELLARTEVVDSAPPTETGRVDPEDRATTQSPGRSRVLHAERVWPD